MISVSIASHRLDFIFPAGTSRGVYHQHMAYYIKIETDLGYGIGEAAPLPGLSIESGHKALAQLKLAALQLSKLNLLPTTIKDAYALAHKYAAGIASVRFAIESALLAYINSIHSAFEQIHYANEFSAGIEVVIINGLIWMGDRELMLSRINQKLAKGFTCLKMKIGAINIEEEIGLLRFIRSTYKANELTLRVDANGAFEPENALAILEQLAELNIHSIEQPIKAGQEEHMYNLCMESPIAIALDEELIPVSSLLIDKVAWLQKIQPQFIILKPTLLGGFGVCKEWILAAEKLEIGWWLTSALESNIGLNAIAQFAANYPLKTPQGLGTGQLYANNIKSPLELNGEQLGYNPELTWDFSNLYWEKIK